MANLYDLLSQSADSALELMSPDGYRDAGHNGPWEDPQTSVRNTSHWLITFLHCYRMTGEEKYREGAEDAVAYLTSDEARPYGKTFYHLREHEKSRCNGLVGQAWTIEALIAAAEELDRPELLTMAEDVFLLHPFDETLAAWHYVDIDGRFKALDKVFNHQLWFAMVGGLLASRPETSPIIGTQVQRFLDELDENMNIYDSGLIYHPFKPDFDFLKYTKVFLDGVRSGVAHKMIKGVIKSNDSEDPMKETSIGYHTFNLYAFAVLNKCFPAHPFWGHPKFLRTLSYARSEEFKRKLDENPYGYPYNCAGIEMAYVLEVFSNEDEEETQRQWLKNQFSATPKKQGYRLGKNNPDPATLTARLYEASRIPDIDVPLDQRGE